MRKRNHKKFFWLKVEMGDGCWNWMGTKNNSGYGVFRIRGKVIRAHRYSFEIFYGPIPVGKFICHHCDNPACVSPKHLFVGTAKENSADMMKKGRNMHVVKPWTLPHGDRNGTRTRPDTVRKGEKIEWHKLTADEVVQIRERYWSGETAIVLGKEFGVYKSTIYKAVYGFKWKSVPMASKAPESVKIRHKTLHHLT